jgi:hypothetical protein
MTKLDEKHYHRLTLKERIELTIAALSRNDNEEIARLRRTCERRQYIMLDYEYTSKLENLAWVSSKFEALHNSYYHNLILFMSSMATQKEIDDIAKYYLAFVDQAACIKSLYEALYAFCNEAELNKHHVMKWLKIDPQPIFKFIGEKVLAAAETNVDLVMHLKNRFLAIWNGDIS